MQAEIWSDVACPWCYIGKRRFEEALQSFPHRDEVEVTWRSFQLDPGLPAHYDGSELDYLSERKGFPRDRVGEMFAHVAEQAAGMGLDYDFEHLIVANSFTAHRLLQFAKVEGAGDAVKEGLLSAHFEHGADIGDVDVLVSIATSSGLDPERVREVLAGDEYADDVRRDIADATSLGIQGVPFFVIDRTLGVSGAQPAESIRAVLDQGWTAAHPLQMIGGDDGQACGIDGCD